MATAYAVIEVATGKVAQVRAPEIGDMPALFLEQADAERMKQKAERDFGEEFVVSFIDVFFKPAK